jgi:hypothetical protein
VCLCEWPLAISREKEREKETTISLMVSAKAVVKINTKKEKRKNELFSHRELFITILLPSFFLYFTATPFSSGTRKISPSQPTQKKHTQREMIHIYFVNDVGSAYIT